MLVQYTAASLVSECKSLAHPASVDSIPSSAGQEDHVSMGMIAARHARDIVANAELVVALEALAAAQALDLRSPLEPAEGTRAARDAIRDVVPFLEVDREFRPDIDACLGAGPRRRAGRRGRVGRRPARLSGYARPSVTRIRCAIFSGVRPSVPT